MATPQIIVEFKTSAADEARMQSQLDRYRGWLTVLAANTLWPPTTTFPC